MPRSYEYLTEDERRHFVEHGWLRVRNAIKKKYMDDWMQYLWPRLGMSPSDMSTWHPEYVTMPPQHEVRNEELCPDAWNKISELVGGAELIDPLRDRWFSDQFHINFGTPENVGKPFSRDMLRLVHCDNDFFRQFLDSGECVLTVILAFTDSDEQGGATAVFEEGIKKVCETWYRHPEGCEPPFSCRDVDPSPYKGLKETGNVTFLDTQAGDVIITHDFLPHSANINRKPFAKVITNPHVSLTQPLQLYRNDGDYTLVEQVILHHMGRDSIPEYKATRERVSYYPREQFTKRARIQDELERMETWAKLQGRSPESVGSIYQGTEEQIKEHEKRHGYDKPWSANGVTYVAGDKAIKLDSVPWGKQIFSYRDTEVAHLAKPNVEVQALVA